MRLTLKEWRSFRRRLRDYGNYLEAGEGNLQHIAGLLCKFTTKEAHKVLDVALVIRTQVMQQIAVERERERDS